MTERSRPDHAALPDSKVVPATITELLDLGQHLSDGGPALLLEDGRSLSHADLKALLVRAENDLRRLGVERPTRTMTALPDGTLTACVLLALTRSAICVPVNPDLREAELEALIPELEVAVMVAHGPCAEEARRAARALRLPIIEVAWGEKNILEWTGSSLPNSPSSSAVIANPDDTALVLLTSGSSARPKRVPLTHRQLTLAARRMVDSIALTPQDRCLNFMPMFHVGAVVDLLLAPLSAGGSLLRPKTMSVPAFFEAVEHGKPTWFQGVPTLLHELAVQALRQPRNETHPSLRLIRSVSSPLPPEWFSEIEFALRVPVIEIYGMTETAGLITSNPLPPEDRIHGSAGKATDLEIIIREASGAEATARHRGEILVRGPGVMLGYENIGGGNSGLTEDGWLPTGDEGFFNEDGYLFITGRIGERINRGGEKISPREIDEVLASHPALHEAAAFAVTHPQLGQEVAAALVVKPGLEIALASLTAHLSSRLAYFKVPKTYYLVSALPRGPGGKLRRRLLPELVREIPPLADTATEFSAIPQTEMEKRVAAWWEGELRVTGVGRQSHFFDLGGDSLAAASFTVAVGKALGVEIRPAALFDHPTTAAFASYLEQAVAARRGTAGLPEAKDPAVLAHDFHLRLLAAMSVWPGERRDERSLLIGLRTEGTGMPVFWCGQGRSEFGNIAAHWPVHQPIYGTRSLFLFEGKKKRDEAALALMLSHEIETLAAGREFIVGGFCAGGRIAFEAALHLRTRGVPIKMVFMHDAWSNQRIDVPVALGFSQGYHSSPHRQFYRPEMSLRKRFSGGWKLWVLPREHHEVYDRILIGEEVQKLCVLAEHPAGFDDPAPLEEVPAVAYRARLSSWLPPRSIRVGSQRSVRVTITNLSCHTWLPGDRSGLHLGHRWLDLDGQSCGDPGPSVPLPRAVSTGKSITLTIKVTAPNQACTQWLEVDMVDEGIKWFSEKTSKNPSKSLRIRVNARNRFRLGIFGRRSHLTNL